MAETSHWTGSEKYLCDKELAQAFHMARTLGMPLLIEGEPGTGKFRYTADGRTGPAKPRGLHCDHQFSQLGGWTGQKKFSSK